MRNCFLAFALVFLASGSFASVNMLSPVSSPVNGGSTVQIGNVSPGQVFELVFEDDSGHGFEWDSLSAGSLPSNWELVSSEVTDASLIARFFVPRDAKQNYYVIPLSFSSSSSPGLTETINASVVVRNGLLDVSFARVSPAGSVVGDEVDYKVVVSNSSIAPYSISVGSTLPENWFSGLEFTARPNSSEEFSLKVRPLVYGNHGFSFIAVSEEDNLTAGGFSSELNVKPTLKGKFSSALTGFPFFTFSLTPFQLFDSFAAFILPN